MDLITGIFSAFGLSASAGLNAYIPLLVVALLGRYTNLIHLNPPYDALSSWWVIGALAVLSLVEFFADKIPAVNHVNDVIQTFVRPVAGAIIFAASANVLTDVNPVLSLIAGLLVAGSVHAVKAVAVRPAVTVTTAGAGNVAVSVAEDFVSTVLSILSVIVPLVVGLFAIIIIAWLILRLRRRSRVARLA
jgi:Domain of unknown function (DUF4126)